MAVDGETMETVTDFILGGSKITADGDCSYEIKTLAPWKTSYDQPILYIKNQRHYFAKKGLPSQSCGFSSSHVQCESWIINTAEHRRTDASELWCWRRLLRIPWTAKRSNQSWIFIGRTDVETKTPVLFPPDMKNWLIGKDRDSGKDWRQEEKGTTEDEMVGWRH